MHIDCTREVVRVSHAISKHRDEIQYLKQILSSLSIGGAASLPSALESLQKRIVFLENGDSEGISLPESPPVGTTGGRDVDINRPRAPQVLGLGLATQASSGNGQPTTFSKEKDSADMVTILEYLAWGRHYGACYPHRKCTCSARRSASELISINSDPTTRSAVLPILPRDPSVIPSAEVASKMVNFHISQVAWHHNSIHSPTFLEQCENYWETGTCDHPLWMALYCSVLSVSPR